MPKRASEHHPVDRGWAWVVLAASMGSHYLNGTFVYSVGVLHAGLLNTFEPDTITLVVITGAVNSSLMCIAAPLATYIINRYGCRTCTVLGGLLCFAGYASSSFVTSVLLLFFTFGVTAGVGLGLTYSATNITIGFYFDRLRGVVSGISNAFQGVGILTGSVIFQALMDTFGLSGTFLLLGGASLHFCFFGMFFRPTIYEGTGRQKGNTIELVVYERDQEIVETRLLVCSEKATAEAATAAKPHELLSQLPTHEEVSKRGGDVEEERKSLLLGKSEGHRELTSLIETCEQTPHCKKVSNSGDHEEERKLLLLLERNDNVQGEGHGEVTSGLSRARNATEEVRTAVPGKTAGTRTDTSSTVGKNVILVKSFGKDLNSVAQACMTTPSAGACKHARVENTSPALSEEYERGQDGQNQVEERLLPDTTSRSVSKDSQLSNPQTTNNSLDQADHTTTTTTNTSDFPISSELSCFNPSRSEEDPHGRLSTEKERLNDGTVPDQVDSERLELTNVVAALSSGREGVGERGEGVRGEGGGIGGEGGGREGEATRRRGEDRRCGACVTTLTNTPLMLHSAALFVSNAHVSGVFLHLPEYVQQHGTQPFQAAELFLAVGCTSLLSKLACGFALVDPSIDPLVLSVGMMGLSGILTCCFPLFADTYGMQMLFSALFGLYFGGLYAISNPILVRFADVSRLAETYGISYFILGLGYFLGPMMAAMIVDGGGTYGHSFLFLGIMMLSGSFLDMAAAACLQSRDKLDGAKQPGDWSVEEVRGGPRDQSPLVT